MGQKVIQNVWCIDELEWKKLVVWWVSESNELSALHFSHGFVLYTVCNERYIFKKNYIYHICYFLLSMMNKISAKFFGYF